MSNLLTRQEYLAIAEAIDFPRSAFIDGRYKPGSGALLPTINPATGELICEIAACNSDDVDFAVGHDRGENEGQMRANAEPVLAIAAFEDTVVVTR